MTTKREQSRIDQAMKRFADERKRLNELAEAGPSFVPVSDGSGRKKNTQLRKPEEMNQHSTHPTERRTPGWPSTFGPMARAAQEQAETANEARARLLSPSSDRIAREAMAARAPEPDRVSWWVRALHWSIVAYGVVLFLTLAYCAFGPLVWDGRP